MRLISLFENFKQELLELQEWLLEQGWDDVRLEHHSDSLYRVTLIRNLKLPYERLYWCSVDNGKITGWTDINPILEKASNFRLDDREVRDKAIDQLTQINIYHDLKLKLVDKPESFREIKAHEHVPYSKLKPLIDKGQLQILQGNGLFVRTYPDRPLNSRSSITVPSMLIVNFITASELYEGRGMWLVDSSAADSYFRKWAFIQLDAF